LKLFSKLKF